MLSELFEQLPEIGDPENQAGIFSLTKPTCCSMKRPRYWSSASSWWCAWRPKGVGVYFVTQNPLDS
jgi:hypothetical protein